MTPPTRPGRTSLLVLGGLLLLMALWATADWYSALPLDIQATYVGRDRCATCHQNQVRQWIGSDHDRAMELPTEETVLGDFDNAAFTRFGVTTRFFRKEGKYFVNTEGPDGEFQDFEIKYTFGIRPLQQYMVEFPDGRVQVLRVSWDTRKNRWFYVTPSDVPDERIEPGDPLHWTGVGQNWNTMCAECHSTNLQKNYDLETNSYHTTYSEIDVSCETCHGPGSIHVELAESNSLFWDRNHGYGLAKLKGTSAEAQIETCAPCHSRRSPIHPGFAGGKEFFDHYNPALLYAGLYHTDGQILDEVYVYGSFLQSKMHTKGVRCTDCHNPHSLKLKFEGNRLCTQCHAPGKYDSPSHHHHVSPEATQCVACHMPARTYMNIDERRDHSFRVPRPDLTVKLGTPNACNDCHNDPLDTPEWAAEKVRQWYGDKRPDDPHFAVTFAAAQQGEPEGLDLVRELLRRKDSPDIVRATAVELLANYRTTESDRLCREGFRDLSPLVRAAAVRSISRRSLGRFVNEVAQRLQDPVRLVRSAAAQRLVQDAAAVTDSEYKDTLEAAISEYLAGERMTQERAGAHINMATLSKALGKYEEAKKSLETAVRLEPYLSDVRGELAGILERLNGNPDEIRRLREEEVALMERNSKLFPNSPQPHYQRGMLLYLLQRNEEALEAFEEACRLAPNSFDNWMALALICEKEHRWEQAVEALKNMNRLRPKDPQVIGLYQKIRQTALAEAEVEQGENQGEAAP
ncbi:MAG: tetratricopeptide repeat protein, partial [Pirellulales bacterium]|nr:tetratricopeptide repeat protein [Pirellulales bacterium]